MGIDMKAFMKPELKDRGTMEFPGIERYKDAEGNKIPFIIKRLSMKKIKEIRNNHKTKEVYRDKRTDGVLWSIRSPRYAEYHLSG